MVAKCIIDKSIVIDENDNYGTLKIKICMVALREEFLYQQEKCLAVLASTSIITILHQNISAVIFNPPSFVMICRQKRRSKTRTNTDFRQFLFKKITNQSYNLYDGTENT